MDIIKALYAGATPDLDRFVEELGDRIFWLREYKNTPQDSEWHGEGDVFIHTGMVLEETHAILDKEASHLNPSQRVSLILGALLHDIAKPVTTREQEIAGIVRTVAPRHATIGRSYLALKLLDLGLDYQTVANTLGLVGYHHHPKQLVIKDKSAGDYSKLARLANPELLYWLELADIRGRKCPDKQQQLDYIEMYGLFAQEYKAWQPYGEVYRTWQTFFNRELINWSRETRDLVFARAISNYEAGKISFPEEELARSYSYREAFPQVVLTFGISGSGKSTWIEQNLPDYEVISLDNLRAEILGDRTKQSENSKIVAVAKERLKTCLRAKTKAVWDATNLRRDFRQQVINIARNYGALVTLVVFHCPENIYAERNRKRQHSIPSKVLQRQLEVMEFPELDESDRVIIVDETGRTIAQYGFNN